MVKPLVNEKFGQISYMKHGFFTRKGGVSTGVFDSLNINNHSEKGEDVDIVDKNLEIIGRYFSSDAFVMRIKQKSENKVITITKPSEISRDYEADAIVTNLNNLVIGVSTADCVPILLADKNKKIIGVVHAGWKGALGGVIENAIEEMKKLGATEIVASLGAHLRVDSFEVKEDFIEILNGKFSNGKKYIKSTGGKTYFDITKFVIDVLNINGIFEIYDDGFSSFTDEENFFSYRRSCARGEKRFGGNFSGIIIL